MTRRHFVAVATVIRDSDLTMDDKVVLANAMADAIGPIAKNFDRNLFMAYATSATLV